MQESEFRDWARRAQGSFDERLKVLEAKVGALDAASTASRERVRWLGSFLKDGIALAEEMVVEARAGRVAAFGIAYVTIEGEVNTGWTSRDHFALVGAIETLRLRVVDEVTERPRWGGLKAWSADSSEAAGAASAGTDEGSAEAREVAASAPAGGAA
jgi:hypothetical protein